MSHDQKTLDQPLETPSVIGEGIAAVAGSAASAAGALERLVTGGAQPITVRGMLPQYDAAVRDVLEGFAAWKIWVRLGSQEVRRRYRRTVLGPFWATLSLGIFLLAMGIVWAQLWNQPAKTYLPFVSSGMIVWTMVAALINEGCTVFWAADGIIKQLRFPYTMLVCAVVWRNMLLFFHNLAIFLAVAFFTDVPVTSATPLAIPGLIIIFFTGTWVVTLIGLLCSRYRDMQQVIMSLLQITMFVTPIFFSADQLGPRFKLFVGVNLLYHYVDIVRSPLLGKFPALWSWAVCIGGMIAGWVFTLFIYSRFRRRLAYWL